MPAEDFKPKIAIALGANTAPDIFITWTGGGMIEYINADKIIPLTKYLNQGNYKDYFMDAGIAQATYKGDIWAVPGIAVSVAFLWYNKPVFNSLGITVPSTIPELEAACDKMVANGIIPFGLANKAKYRASFFYMYLVDRYAGTQRFEDAANRANGVTFEDEAFLWADRKIQEWARKGYFGEGYNGLDGEVGVHREMFYNRECAMILDGSWVVSIFNDEEAPIEDFSLFPFPAVVGGKGDANGLVGTIGDSFYCVSSSSPYPDECFDLIRHLIDDTSVQGLVKAGRIPPTKNATAANELNTVVLESLKRAPTVQLWYDQYLPSAMGEIHKDELQALVGLNITPEAYNAAMEKAAQSYLTNQ
jgi:raffinose/stachyose/melibiose transport system substrate-binding protein